MKDSVAITLIDFDKDEATQDLLGYAGIDEPYEDLICRVSLEILQRSVPCCQIESVRFVRQPGMHPDVRVGGMPLEEDSTKIRLQDMTLPFDLEITVQTENVRHLLDTTFTFECRKMDCEQENEFMLDIRGQRKA